MEENIVKQLRIGNIASFFDEDKDEWVDNVIVEDLYKYDEYRGVPLTEEWLVKFGFKSELDDPECVGIKSANGQYNVISNGDYNLEIMFGFTKDGSILVHLNDCDFKHCQYVHQLQNLYFALTGEELTTPQ